ERDDGAILQNRLPAEVRDEPLHQRAHAVLTLVGHRPQRVGGEEEFLVLGANPPGAGGLGTRGDPGDELVARAHGWGRWTGLAGGQLAKTFSAGGGVCRWVWGAPPFLFVKARSPKAWATVGALAHVPG